MPEFMKRRSEKAGLPPGTVVPIGSQVTGPSRITVMDYDESREEERPVEKIEDVFQFKDTSSVTWINVDGVYQTDPIEKIGRHFGFHPLVLEDIANTGQRPKMEDHGEYIFVVLKMLRLDPKTGGIISEQLSLILGTGFVVSFQEVEGDVFDALRDRIRSSKGRIRKMKADYLAYALIDAIADNYFVILEKLGERMEEIEGDLVANPRPETLQEIHSLKREMIRLRKSVWPLREALSKLERSESDLIAESTRIYIRDVYDHSIQVIDTVESLRDMVSGMLDTYLSSVSNRMNEVMKVLTIIATIFIPITFIAGVYGMNFAVMPELGWNWAYFAVLGIMAGVAIAMLIYFKRKRWL
ncbi:magnesium/cobalt transporter CorA [Candidatus Eisenbacteria bacterium]|uniref:Magnesium transport protein CorA n=1 Tax=Eiseniibacteriota bacterium TaxID=2212470 RepID=A0ABV6YNL9_UNCEI